MRELLDLIDRAARAGPPDLVFDRLHALAERVQGQVERMERDLTDARVLLEELRASLERRPAPTGNPAPSHD
jgi:hypothetical protein